MLFVVPKYVIYDSTNLQNDSSSKSQQTLGLGTL